ncbi:MAG TPA: acyl-CoA dehydrogenase family protein, partial [Tepidiformaceae bacterium]|nr:acyl-CoA dehydrogenase family protein [Tepidiformaceae bacterium]
MNPRDLVAPVADDILQMAAQAEAERRLPERLMERLTQAGLFSIYTPSAFGGLELPLPVALRVVEEVSRLDGSTGWTVALGFANDCFTSVLPDESAAQVLHNGSALIAGSPGF